MKIGIDIGGMSVKCALCDGARLVKSASAKTVRGDVPAMVNCIDKLIRDCCSDKSKIESVGVGVPGTVDGGKVLFANNLGWEDVDLADMLAQKIKLPVKLANDAYCALLAEIEFGAGKNLDNALMVTFGTGIGVKAVMDGHVLRGNKSCGMEAGHIKIHDRNLRNHVCNCGIEGCWEGYASTSALIVRTKSYIEDNPSSIAASLAFAEGGVDGQLVFRAIAKGDAGARELLNEHMNDVLDGLVGLCNIFRPEVIIVGGGISERFELFKAIEEALNECVYGRPNTPEIRIVKAELGNGAGIVGASLL